MTNPPDQNELSAIEMEEYRKLLLEKSLIKQKRDLIIARLWLAGITSILVFGSALIATTLFREPERGLPRREVLLCRNDSNSAVAGALKERIFDECLKARWRKGD